MIAGIVLAAGASSRMGRPKALLPAGEGLTFLQRLASTFATAGLDTVVAVVGNDAAAIEDHAARAALQARLVRNPRPERGQLSSLIAALDALEGLSLEAVAVLPVDLPLVSAATVAQVLTAWRSSSAPVARPVRADGRHGHPVVFAARLFPELRAADLATGARQILRSHADEILDVPVSDEGAFEDIDTVADYERLIGPLL